MATNMLKDMLKEIQRGELRTVKVTKDAQAPPSPAVATSKKRRQLIHTKGMYIYINMYNVHICM